MGRSFHVEGPKTEKEREPAVENLVHGVWRLNRNRRSGEDGKVCKEVEDSHRSDSNNWRFVFVSRRVSDRNSPHGPSQ